MDQSDEIDIDRTIFAESKRLGLMAINSSTRYKIPPVPRVYEVWFTYFSGHNQALVKHVDQARRSGTVLDGNFIEQLYDEHLSPEALKGGVTRLGDKMEGELSQALSVIQTGLAKGASFSEVLGGLRMGLSREMGTDGLRQLVTLLQEASTAYAAECAEMTQQLEETRAQIRTVQNDLRELRESAFLDHVTRLPNRRQFQEALDQEIAAVREHGQDLCVARVDIDNFKHVVDTWGMDAGETVLRKFAEILRQNIKGRDVPARLGNDEFALIFPGTALSGAHVIAEHIRRSIGRTTLTAKATRQRMDKVTVSFGVTALRAEDGMSTLMARAEDHLARAKSAGRDQVWSAD